MTKILVLSDSHGNLNNMVYAVKQEKPDRIIHLGDCWGDACRLHQMFADIPMDMVPGNCDYQQEPEVRILILDGFHVLICHGHTYQVKQSYLSLQYAAQEKQVHAALFGHTHKVFYDHHNGIHYLNPGSIGAPGYQTPPSYGLLYLDAESGQLKTEAKYIETAF